MWRKAQSFSKKAGTIQCLQHQPHNSFVDPNRELGLDRPRQLHCRALTVAVAPQERARSTQSMRTMAIAIVDEKLVTDRFDDQIRVARVWVHD